MSQVTSMEGMISAALKILKETEDYDLPREDLKNAKGVVIMESIQAGFFFSAQVGTGILLLHDKATDSWSNPLAIGLTGVGAGLAIGAEKKNMIILLNDDQMTQAMASDFSFRFGFDQSWAIGKVGEGGNLAAQVGNKGSGMSVGHSTNVGIYTGISADGTLLAPRTHVNEKYYGKKLKPKEIVFDGAKDPPPSADLVFLYSKLSQLVQEAS